MDELKLTEFASKIDHFEDDANFKKIYFKRPKDITALKESLTELGITDVMSEQKNGISPSDIEYVFEVNYRYSDQRKIIDDLERRHTRLKAWNTLRGNGGAQMSDTEQKFFATKDREIKILKDKMETGYLYNHGGR